MSGSRRRPAGQLRFVVSPGDWSPFTPDDLRVAYKDTMERIEAERARRRSQQDEKVLPSSDKEDTTTLYDTLMGKSDNALKATYGPKTKDVKALYAEITMLRAYMRSLC
jgi:hypothetical protein